MVREQREQREKPYISLSDHDLGLLANYAHTHTHTREQIDRKQSDNFGISVFGEQAIHMKEWYIYILLRKVNTFVFEHRLYLARLR